MFFLTSIQRMTSVLLTTFAAAILAGASAGFLRGSTPSPVLPPMLLPTPPIHEMVVIPYESPEVVSARLHRMALRGTIDHCLKNESVLIIADDFSASLPTFNHAQSFKKSKTNVSTPVARQLA
jgi:hypothetical protein